MNAIGSKRLTPKRTLARSCDAAAAEHFLRWAHGYRTGGSAFDRFPDAVRESIRANGDAVVSEFDAGTGGKKPGKPFGQVTHDVAGGPSVDRGWRVPGPGSADPLGEQARNLPMSLGWAIRQRHR